jgi:hypothetical protein
MTKKPDGDYFLDNMMAAFEEIFAQPFYAKYPKGSITLDYKKGRYRLVAKCRSRSKDKKPLDIKSDAVAWLHNSFKHWLDGNNQEEEN